MQWFLVLALVPALVPALVGAASRVPRSCGPCEPGSCPALPAKGCAFRLMDACGCCEMCAAEAGEPCGGKGVAAARCVPGLDCVITRNGVRTLTKKGEFGVCACKAGDFEVCGSDGVEYRSACELKAASAIAERAHKPAIKVQKKGKCARAPVIVTPPGEVWNVTGTNVFLSCEAIGYPTPVLTWRKVSDDNKKTLLLPSDQQNLAIQTRGGPEKHEVTGWVLISPLTKKDEGTYECYVSNAKGEVSARGTIHVVDSINDIPSKKVVKDDEL
ncbi:insulin-like growth factor-binding protein 7 [Trichomycterus rosablanca]|uniref:insulin-like growth factor-binding protein 7 n=1 Tax=Trichomycterus rosablanca TaxID=2290929 RepID=UPI002F355AFD